MSDDERPYLRFIDMMGGRPELVARLAEGHEPTHSFDVGAASTTFALDAGKMGSYVHCMAGFDKDRAFAELGVPKGLPGRGGLRRRQAW